MWQNKNKKGCCKHPRYSVDNAALVGTEPAFLCASPAMLHMGMFFTFFSTCIANFYTFFQEMLTMLGPS
jgi:hypothetical protein